MHTTRIDIREEFSFLAFENALGISIQMEYEEDREWYFTIEGQSTTMFLLKAEEGGMELSMSEMASYKDYKILPYLCDMISLHFNGSSYMIDGQSVYEVYNEDWAEEMIGEEVALLKSTLSVAPRYYVDLAMSDYSYVDKRLLAKCAVGLNSSTPRIYGYIQLMMKRELLPEATNREIIEDMQGDYAGVEVDVPQHISIGKIKSWHIDGAETWDSFSSEDIGMLICLSQMDDDILAEVMNDIGAIYQEGVGVEIDGEKAEYWFKRAISAGDHRYAPTNLGDLYRKGCGTVGISLQLAFEAYSVSEDPYAWYRIGEAYEEGWLGKKDIDMAMVWYEKAAGVGHWRAKARLRPLQNCELS